MNYLKKICLLKEYKMGFSSTGKSLSGLIKCEQHSKSVKIELSVLNLAPPKDDSYILFMGNSAKNIIYNINSGFCNFNCNADLFDISKPFAVAILLEKTQQVVLFGKTLDYSYSLNEFLKLYKDKSLTLYLEEEQTQRQIDEEFLYSDDIVATENYYEKEDVDLQNLTLKDSEDEKFKNEDTSCKNIPQEEKEQKENNNAKNEQFSCSIKENLKEEPCPSLTDFATTIADEDSGFCISEDIENLLNSYPRFAELENAIYNSKWVTITLDSCEYYFGKIIVGQDVYLGYAVRGEDGCCPQELKHLATFIPSPYSNNLGYFVMFQKEN